MWQTLPTKTRPPAVDPTDHVVRALFIVKGPGMFFSEAGSVLPCVSSMAKYQFLCGYLYIILYVICVNRSRNLHLFVKQRLRPFEAGGRP